MNKPQITEMKSPLKVAADLRGHFSHGLSRLAHYVSDVRAGTCDPKAEPAVVGDDDEDAATALVDGRNGLGVVVGEFRLLGFII